VVLVLITLHVLFMAVPMGLQWHLFHLLFRCGACG